jgi:hypothetical protein
LNQPNRPRENRDNGVFSSHVFGPTELDKYQRGRRRSHDPVTLSVLAGESAAPFSVARTLRVPAGWTAEVWARVPDARMEDWSPEGDLLVSEPDEGNVVALRPGAGAQSAPAERTVLAGLTEPQGLAFSRLDSSEVLYVGESDQIDRYGWKAATVAGSQTVVAGNLPDLDHTGDDVHRQKDVVVTHDGTVYFNASSSSSADPEDRTMTPPRGVIMAVDPNGGALHVVPTGPYGPPSTNATTSPTPLPGPMAATRMRSDTSSSPTSMISRLTRLSR